MRTLFSRVDITGPVDIDCPLVVMLEILEAHGMEIEPTTASPLKLVRVIQQLEPLTITMDARDYPSMARFVNPRAKWTPGALRKAFKFLSRWVGECHPLDRDFQVGKQTPHNLYSINACVLFKACRQEGIALSFHTTLDEMACVYRLTKFPPPDIHLYLSTKIADLPLSTLIRLVATIGLETGNDSTQEHRNVDPTLLSNDGSTCEPQEAIALAAYYYSVDISESLCPLMAYSLVRDSPELFRSPDTSQHPEAYPCLEYHFNPYLPISYYSNNALTSLISHEGLSSISREDGYQKLQEASKSLTFQVRGKRDTTTVIYSQPVEEIPFGQVVFYRDRALSLIELKEWFHNSCSFIDPTSMNKEMFTPPQIRKLIAICQHYPSEAASELQEVIEQVELMLGTCCRQHTEFLEYYRRLDSPTKERIVDIFWSLHRLGMYMRGWDGQGELPIVAAPVDNQLEVDIRVTEAINDLDTRLHALPDQLRRRIMELNLYCYRNSELRVSTPQDTVPTLGLRLELVRGGTELETIESCIRTSSNYFAATSHYYLKSLGANPGYSLSKLRYIS